MKKILSKCFTFEAAHRLMYTKDKINENIHGHSFFVEISIEEVNESIEKNGMIIDLSILEKKLYSIKKVLDHAFLNDIVGLNNPTLENIGVWICERLKKEDISLYRIKISRKSCGESFEIFTN